MHDIIEQLERKRAQARLGGGEKRIAAQQASGRLAERRHAQDQAWMWERIEAGLRQRFKNHAAVREALPRTTDDVRAGGLAPSVAARRLLDLLN